MDVTIERIIKEIHEETSIDKRIVRVIVKSLFRFLKRTMKENLATRNNPSILFNFLGTFKVKPGRARRFAAMQEVKSRRVLDYATGKIDAYK